MTADIIHIALILSAGLVGGLLRGYSGFGFAMAAVPILSLGFAPQVAVPVVLIHELAIGLFAVRAERESFDRSTLIYLMVGSVLGTPIGLFVLTLVPAQAMKIAVAVCILIAVGVLWLRRGPSINLGPRTLGLAGFISGLLNGSTAMSGPPAIIAFVGSSLPAQRVRGILIYFILFSAFVGVLLSLIGGLQTLETLQIAAIMTPGVLVGAVLGIRAFHILPKAHYRSIGLMALLVISIVSLATNLLQL